MLEQIKEEIITTLREAGVTGDIELSTPPKPEMGDFAFACFAIAKEQGKSPIDIAKEISDKLGNPSSPRPTQLRRASKEIRKLGNSEIVEKVEAFGPYVNFFVNIPVLAEHVLTTIQEQGESFGSNETCKGKRVLVEYGCPNPLKVFHLGHLKNLITGESIARILAYAGYEVVRVNYQGDVGMHVAKAMWGIEQHTTEIKNHVPEPLQKRLAFLGQIYAEGAKAFEEDPKAKEEIVAMNKRIYEKDPTIQELYKLTVGWSLEYFDQIYKRLDTRFDRLYMESQVFGPGLAIVREYLKKGVFKESDGAVIYEGSKHNLHDRVFINSEGFPTYEAKDLGLSQAHFTDYTPDRMIHVVGKEQTEYFKVVIKAIEEIWPERKGKEFHLPGGFLQLKEGKMSSRTGNVVSGEALLNQVRDSVRDVMLKTRVHERVIVRTPPEFVKQDVSSVDKEINDTVEKVAVAAMKYAILKVHVSDDVAFDMKTSVSVEGDSGPYLLYIVARIKSILKKARKQESKKAIIIERVESEEKQLLLTLAEFPTVTKKAAETLDPSHIAQYLFTLAQRFNTFYHACPVLQADQAVQRFRLSLIQSIIVVMTSGLQLLGIETVEEM